MKKEKVKDLREKIENAKWVLKLGKQYRAKIVGILVLGIVNSVAGIVISLIVKELIDFAAGGSFSMKNMVLYAVILLASLIIGQVWNFLSVDYDEKITQQTRKKFLNIILRADWTGISKFKNGDLQTRLSNDVDKISDGITDMIPGMLTFCVQLILTVAVLMYVNWAIAVTALVFGLIGMIICFLVKGKVYPLQNKVQEAESTSRSHLTESCSDIAYIKSYSAEGQMNSTLENIQKDKYKAVRKLSLTNIRTSFSMSLIFNISYLLAFGLGVYFLSGGKISYGTLSLYIVLAGRVQSPMISIARGIPQIIWMLSSAGRLKELEDIPVEKIDDEKLPSGKYGIDVNNMSFAYREDLPTVFENVSFDIKPGEIIGIVGHSGSGKTTLIRLMLALVHPLSGTVSFLSENGEKHAASVSSRKLIGYVPQGNMSMSGTIRDNVCFGAGTDVSDDNIIEALKIADAYDFVMKTENGLDTPIGENGIGLSQGQAQRIAIARAFVVKRPVIILDEATSALDEKTEKTILNNIAALEDKPTCIFVTHRKAALEICDRILSVSEGGCNYEK